LKKSIVFAACAACLVSLAHAQIKDASATSEDFKRTATVVEDGGGDAKTKISAEDAHNRSFLRAFVDTRSGEITYQVYTRNQYSGTKYRLYRTAYFQAGKGGSDSAPVVVLSRASEGCDAKGKCEFREDSGFLVSDAAVRAAAKDYLVDPATASEWKFRLKDKSGDQSDGYLPEAEIAGLLARVDEYIADNKIPRYRPNTVDQPLLSPLSTMVSFGIQGASKSELAPPIAAALGSTDLKGIYVITVSPDSLAAWAGIKVGDDLYEFNGKPIASAQQMQAAVAGAGAGTSVPIKVLRGGATVSMVAQF
jgi:hypothetical protein